MKLVTIFLFLTFEICYSILGPSEAWALDMSSEYFKIVNGTFSNIKGTSTSNNYLSSDDISTGSLVRTKLPYINNDDPFIFSLSSNNLDFGELQTKTETLKNLQLVISTGSSSGFKLLSKQDDAPVGYELSFLIDKSKKFTTFPVLLSGTPTTSLLSTNLHGFTLQSNLTFRLKKLTSKGLERYQNIIDFYVIPGY